MSKPDKTLKVTYCNGTNFGDELNRYILEKYLDRKFLLESIEWSQVIGIGSILDYIFIASQRKGRWLYQRLPIKVFSSGFPFPEEEVDLKLARPVRKLQIYALRGYKSLERMQQYLNLPLDNVVIADGGLLAGTLLTEKIEKEFELGIVPHASEKNEAIYSQLSSKLGGGSIVLDIEKNPLDFLRDLAKCKRIISSALHPLIAADSLGIPNMWVRLHERTTSKYKFEDYYSALDKYKTPTYIYKIDYKTLLQQIDNNYDIPNEIIKNKQKELMYVLEKMKNDLEHEEHRMLQYISYHILPRIRQICTYIRIS